MALLIRIRRRASLVTRFCRRTLSSIAALGYGHPRNMKTTPDNDLAWLGWTRRPRTMLLTSLALLTATAALSLSTPSDAAKVKRIVAGFKLLRNPVWVEAQDANRHAFSFREAVPTVPAETRQMYPFIPKELCVAAL